MSDLETLKAACLVSLENAVEAAQNTFFAACGAGAADQTRLGALMGALDHTKAAYASALKETLRFNNDFVRREQAALDGQVKTINTKLAELKDLNQALKLLNDLARVAGSLATAFA